MTNLQLAFAGGGALVGLAADRLATRWPSHEDVARRGVDWRTLLLILVGAAALAALAGRWDDPRSLALFSVWYIALVVLMATDLDQRLLPDAITLPLIPIALAVLLAGGNPVLGGAPLSLASALVAAIGAPLLLAATNAVFQGGLGMGDLKLAVSLGLVCGVTRLIGGLIGASILGAAVLLVLLAARRIGLRTPIPFGPVLIVGGMLAVLAP